MNHLTTKDIPYEARGSFASWRGMLRKARVHGFTVCARWYDWEEFYSDMGNRPPDFILLADDVSKPFGPGNAHWSPAFERIGGTRQ